MTHRSTCIHMVPCSRELWRGRPVMMQYEKLSKHDKKFQVSMDF